MTARVVAALVLAALLIAGCTGVVVKGKGGSSSRPHWEVGVTF